MVDLSTLFLHQCIMTNLSQDAVPPFSFVNSSLAFPYSSGSPLNPFQLGNIHLELWYPVRQSAPHVAVAVLRRLGLKVPKSHKCC